MNDAYFLLYLIGVQTVFIRTLVNQERKKKEKLLTIEREFLIRIEFYIHVVVTSAQLQHDARGMRDAKQK